MSQSAEASILLKIAAAVGNPPTGHVALFADENGDVRKLDVAGTRFPVGGFGLPRMAAALLPDGNFTINPNSDNCSLYVLPPGRLTANRVLTINNAGGDNTKIVQVVVLDTSSFTYDIQNSTPTLMYQKTANRPAATYQFFHSGGVWGANTHWWTQG